MSLRRVSAPYLPTYQLEHRYSSTVPHARVEYIWVGRSMSSHGHPYPCPCVISLGWKFQIPIRLRRSLWSGFEKVIDRIVTVLRVLSPSFPISAWGENDERLLLLLVDAVVRRGQDLWRRVSITGISYHTVLYECL